MLMASVYMLCLQMTHEGHIRLADLGLSKSVEDVTGTITGTLLYMAPEVLSRKGVYSFSSDMFSYGHILWELWYGRNVSNIYSFNDPQTLQTKAFSEQPSPPEGDEWRVAMEKCWNEDPDKRLEASECCQIFNKYRNELLRRSSETSF